MIFVDKRKLSRTSEVTESNGTAVTLEALHQLAASYFIDRESTLHKLHHIQIASTAIKVNARLLSGFLSNTIAMKKQADRQVQFAAIVFFFLHVLMQQFREDTVQIRFCFSG